MTQLHVVAYVCLEIYDYLTQIKNFILIFLFRRPLSSFDFAIKLITKFLFKMRCPNCGWINSAGQASCEKCATTLQSGAQPAAPPASSKNASSASGGTVVSATAMGRPANAPAWDEHMSPPPVVPPPPAASSRKKPDAEAGKKEMLICPSSTCGYKNTSNSNFCVACGTPLTEGAKQSHSATLLAEDDPQVASSASGKFRERSPQTNTPPADKATPAVLNPRPLAPSFNATVNPWSQRRQPGFKLRPVPREGEQIKAELEFEGESVDLNRANLEPSNTTITSKGQALFEYRDGVWYISNKSSMQTTFIRVDGALPVKKGDILLLGDRLFEFDC